MHVKFAPPDIAHLDTLRCEALALPFFRDERPLRGALGLIDWRLCGHVSRLITAGRVEGALLETILVPARPKLSVDKLFLFGLGVGAELDPAKRRQAIEHMLATLAAAHVRTSALVLPGRSTGSVAAIDAFETFLAVAWNRDDHDELIVLEPHAAQKEMEPVLERERRRERARME